MSPNQTNGMRVLVTGAAQGIGRASCLSLARASLAWRGNPALLLAVDIDGAALSKLHDELTELGATIVTVQGDVTDPDLPQRAVTKAVEELGGLDVLVSNAGFARHSLLTDLKVENWDSVFHANVRAPWLFAKHAHDALVASGGSMVILGSISGVNPQTGLGAYSPSKAAAIMLARQLAVEWAGSGVRVNAVSPGPTLTATTGRIYQDKAILAQRLSKMPGNTIGDADDIADAIVFLSGPDGQYVNGANLIVDGGLSHAAMLEFAKAGWTE